MGEKYWVTFANPVRKIAFVKLAKADNFIFAFGVENSQFATVRTYSVNLAMHIYQNVAGLLKEIRLI